MSFIKERYSAKELADMKILGLPKTKANMIALATREGWSYVEVTGLGGKRREYIPSIPVMKKIIAAYGDGAYLNVYVKSQLIRLCGQLKTRIDEAEKLIGLVNDLLNVDRDVTK